MHVSKSRRVKDKKLMLYDEALQLFIRGHNEREIARLQDVSRSCITARLKRGRERAGKLTRVHAEEARDISMLRIDRGRKLNDVDLRVLNPPEPVRKVGKKACDHCGEEQVEELQPIVEYLALREQWESECSTNSVRRARAWEKLLKAEKRVAEMLGTDAPKELAVYDASARQLEAYTELVKRVLYRDWPSADADALAHAIEVEACLVDGVAPPADVEVKVIKAIEAKAG